MSDASLNPPPTAHDAKNAPAAESAVPHHGPADPTLEELQREGRSTDRFVAVLAVLAAVVFFGIYWVGAAARDHQAGELRNKALSLASALPRVEVVKVRRAATEADRLLPGAAAGRLETAIYPRTNGYIKKRYVDIGDKVQEGDPLADIDTPELDDQLLQAKATLALHEATLEKAKANLQLSEANERRNKDLLARKVIAQQDYDTTKATLGVDQAVKAEAEAQIQVDKQAVQRLADLQSFQKVTAPFRGIVTARNVDVGALVIADSPQSAKEMFHLVQMDPIKVIVAVPQVFAGTVKPEQTAVVFRREAPQQTFKGVVARTASALALDSRTLRTELEIPNPDRILLPGMYVQVRFQFARDVLPALAPVASVIAGSEGLKVAVLGAGNVVEYRAVTLGRDYGSDVEVLSGLSGDETVIVRPGDALPAGAKVEPVESGAKP